MPHDLRPYQTDLVERAEIALQTNNGVVIQLATGAGKTVIAAELASRWSKNGERVALVAHRREIVEQARATLGESALVATIAEAARLDFAPDRIIVDECHHMAADSWAAVAEAFPNAKLLGLSATPGRLDGKPLDPWFQAIVEGPSVRWLIEAGYLARYRYFAPSRPDLSGVKLVEGEYQRAGAERVMRGAKIVGDVVDHYCRLAEGRAAILFAISVKASREMAARFTAAGVPAAHVGAETPPAERAAAIAALRGGALKALCNVELFTEGFDAPDIGALILMRPTKSLTLARQMVGRALRKGADPRPVVILDHCNLFDDHRGPDEERVWTLDGRQPPRKSEVEGGARERFRRCPECAHVHPWGPVCLDCGHAYAPGAREATEIAGELKEISGAPPGCVTKAEYARMRGLTVNAVRNRVKLGSPTVGNWVPVDSADVWIAARIVAQRKLSSERVKAKFDDREFAERVASAARKLASDPNHQAKLSAGRAKRLDDPQFRELDASRMRERMKRESSNTARLSGLKAALADPGYKLRQSERMKSRWGDEKIRQDILDARRAKRLPSAAE